jgi:magnesium transporter
VRPVAAYLRSLDPRLPREVYVLELGALVNAFGNGVVLPFLLPSPAPAAPAVADRRGSQPRVRGRRARARATTAGTRAADTAGRTGDVANSDERVGSIPGPCPRPQTPSVPMPSLPRIRSRRAAPGAPVVEPRPAPAELQAGGVTWVHLLSPTTGEAQLLASRFGWHPLDVEDVLSRRQRPKVDVYAGDDDGHDGYLFTVLHFPVYDAAVGRLNAGELDAFIGPDYLVTLPAVELRPVSLLFRRCEENEDFRDQLLSRGTGRLFYEVLDDLYDYCFPILDKIGFKLEQIDESIGEDQGARDLVTDIHKVKQEIISYRKIIKPQRPTLRQLERQIERQFLPEELELYFDDLVDASERIWDLLDNYKEVVEALEDTNESLISHQQNDILYVLTIFSVVLLPLTLLTGFFGMNVHFPGVDTWDAFWASLGLMAVTIVGMLAFFRWKRWL